MKVKELYIKKYHQFEDFKLDLTYPEGYKDKDGSDRAGQPLDKVCFIGQSGTGKTSLLRLIKYLYLSAPFDKSSEDFQEMVRNVLPQSYIDYEVKSLVEHADRQKIRCFATDANDLSNSASRRFKISKKAYGEANNIPENELKNISINEIGKNILSKIKTKIIYYPADIFTVSSTNNPSKDYSWHNEDFVNKGFIDFNNEDARKIWYFIQNEIKLFREEEIKRRLTISTLAQQSRVQPEEIIKATNELSNWLENAVNPIKELADNCLDRILNKFNLRVKISLDFEKIEDVGFVKIESIQGEEIPETFLSTGTKQIVLTALPLYVLKPENTIILFDEPERSLYPDIQKEIVDIYTSLTTDCQFFYATHSPIIASSFEPWEIVELKFNPKTGKIYQELYYEGERHVDNYTINPQYLRWDDILQRVFDLDSEGNEKRVKALMKLATLESKLKNKNLSTEEREILWNEYLKLSKLTGWTTRITDEKN